MRLTALTVAIAVALGLALWLASAIDLSAVALWATEQQRAIQNAMAGDIRAIGAGNAAALLTLCGLTFAYGFVHAIGPGHGKILLGAAALSSRATLRRMAWLTLASSLAQSLTAIILVVGGVQLVSLTSAAAIDLTERYLAPLSYAAIGAIGLLLALRGARATWRALETMTAPKPPVHANAGHDHHHHGACGCGHVHGPSPEQVSDLSNWKEAASLIASIAIRPCTGALFLLVIAWRFQILPAGILATLTMGLGTAAFNILVAGSGVGGKSILARFDQPGRGVAFLSPMAQMAAGFIVVIVSLTMALAYL